MLTSSRTFSTDIPSNASSITVADSTANANSTINPPSTSDNSTTTSTSDTSLTAPPKLDDTEMNQWLKSWKQPTKDPVRAYLLHKLKTSDPKQTLDVVLEYMARVEKPVMSDITTMVTTLVAKGSQSEAITLVTTLKQLNLPLTWHIQAALIDGSLSLEVAQHLYHETNASDNGNLAITAAMMRAFARFDQWEKVLEMLEKYKPQSDRDLSNYLGIISHLLKRKQTEIKRAKSIGQLLPPDSETFKRAMYVVEYLDANGVKLDVAALILVLDSARYLPVTEQIPTMLNTFKYFEQHGIVPIDAAPYNLLLIGALAARDNSVLPVVLDPKIRKLFTGETYSLIGRLMSAFGRREEAYSFMKLWKYRPDPFFLRTLLTVAPSVSKAMEILRDLRLLNEDPGRGGLYSVAKMCTHNKLAEPALNLAVWVGNTIQDREFFEALVGAMKESPDHLKKLIHLNTLPWSQVILLTMLWSVRKSHDFELLRDCIDWLFSAQLGANTASRNWGVKNIMAVLREMFRSKVNVVGTREAGDYLFAKLNAQAEKPLYVQMSDQIVNEAKSFLPNSTADQSYQDWLLRSHRLKGTHHSILNVPVVEATINAASNVGDMKTATAAAQTAQQQLLQLSPKIMKRIPRATQNQPQPPSSPSSSPPSNPNPPSNPPSNPSNSSNNRPTNRPINLLTNRPNNPPTNRSTNPLDNRSTHRPKPLTNRSKNQSSNSPTNPPANPSTNPPTNPPTYRSTPRPKNPSTNRRKNPLTNRPKNPLTNRPKNPSSNSSTNSPTESPSNSPTNSPSNPQSNSSTNPDPSNQ